MKELKFKYSLISIWVLLLTFSCSAQNLIIDNSIGIDRMNLEVRKGIKSLKLGNGVSIATTSFGTPDEAEPFTFEMLDKDGYLYKYSTNRFLFVENEFFTFTLTTSDFQIGIGNNLIKVGDHIDEVAGFFENANSFKENSKFNCLSAT